MFLAERNLISSGWGQVEGGGGGRRRCRDYRMLCANGSNLLQKTSALPHKLPGGLWNCSVPNWSEFQTHFRCNYDTECALAEDETDCPYTGHCKPGQFSADGG